ncbi:MAG: peptidoglycan DD-metalloendopeptidase family protein [Burkholderiaceae bacterium]|jgi:murein DD-endopeptidase MepM/ murein hydrolase activator NlpD
MTPRALNTWIFGSAGLGVSLAILTALGLAPLSEAESALLNQPVRVVLANPSLDEQLKALQAHGLDLSREDEVRRGDTMARLFDRMGIQDDAALAFLNQDRRNAAVLRSSTGRLAVVQTDLAGRLLRLQLYSGDDAWIVERVGEGKFEVRTGTLTAETQIEHRSVEVGQSFFGAMDQAGVPAKITEEVVSLFESDLDFRRQVKPGDKVRVIYEAQRVAGRDTGEHRLIAVRFEASGLTHEALYFVTPEGRGGYYDAEGKSVRRGFLAAPLRYTRISSSFTSYRLHPLFGDPRAHRGVDYAAPVGTPVRAVADGKIVERGYNGGYGNAIEIQHNLRYSTYYAHLSRYAPGIQVGREVRMGEVIGYVGATGWATGPHLHYEFRIQGRSIDPSKIARENPQVPSLEGVNLTAFQAVADDLRKRLSLLDNVNTASLKPSGS